MAFVVNADWVFLAQRLPVARAARDAGADVTVVAADTGRGREIARYGLRFVPLPIGRRSVNPLQELRTVARLVALYRRIRPDLVHHNTIKPVLYGSIAARLVGGIGVVNTVSGLGWVFGSSWRARVVRPVAKALYRWALRGPATRTVFQNPENRDEFIRLGLVPERQATVIRGSGVDLRVFSPGPEPDGLPVVLLAARLLWDKGLKDFVAAAGLVNAGTQRARFVIAGSPDLGNPGAVPVAQLEAWASTGAVEWWGPRTDMPEVMRSASIVVLPTTYAEGVPKVLLEAAASGRSIVATDVPGCREIVRSGLNGFLVAPGDVPQLAQSIRALLEDPALRARFGAEGRRIAVAEFAEERVVAETLAVYRAVLEERWPPVHAVTPNNVAT